MDTYKYHICICVIVHTNMYVLILGINTNSICQL